MDVRFFVVLSTIGLSSACYNVILFVVLLRYFCKTREIPISGKREKSQFRLQKLLFRLKI